MDYLITQGLNVPLTNDNWEPINVDVFITTHSLPHPYVSRHEGENFSVGNFVIEGKKINTPIFYYQHNQSPLTLFYTNGSNIKGIIIITFPFGHYYYIYSSYDNSIYSVFLPIVNVSYNIELNNDVIQVYEKDINTTITFVASNMSTRGYSMENDTHRRLYIVYPI